MLEIGSSLTLAQLQGVADGAPLAPPLVRAMLLLRAQSLALGASGVRPALIDALLAMLNAGVVPQVPAKGSLGASGDLAPLAHMALPLIGEGFAAVAGEVLTGAQALTAAGLEPVELKAKEGLALINGTQLMSAQLAAGVTLARRLLQVADVAAAMSVEGLMGSHMPFH